MSIEITQNNKNQKKRSHFYCTIRSIFPLYSKKAMMTKTKEEEDKILLFTTITFYDLLLNLSSQLKKSICQCLLSAAILLYLSFIFFTSSFSNSISLYRRTSSLHQCLLRCFSISSCFDKLVFFDFKSSFSCLSEVSYLRKPQV